MHINKFSITHHAARRMAQRNLDLGDVALVLRFGRRVFAAGAVHYFFGRSEAAAVARRARFYANRSGSQTVREGAHGSGAGRDQDTNPPKSAATAAADSTLAKVDVKGLDRLVGAVVLSTHRGVIATVYRNRRAFAKIKRKPKRTYKRNRPQAGNQ